MANTDRLLKKDLLNFMQRVAEAGNGAEIIGLPVRFSSDLKSLPKRAEKYQYKLALANLYGWTAYTIYDDLLDQEGDSNKLPLANLAMRRSLLLFQDNGTAEWQKFVSQTFDSIDAANLWEAKSCRWQISGNQITVGKLPAYRNLEMLAEKSLGHMLGPVCILQLTGYGPTSSGSRHVQRALKHYLVARQLNDDLHDWQDDLRRGQITYVVAKVLQESSIRPGRYNINNLSRRLQQHFWNHTLRNVCLVMRRQVVAGRRELARCQLLKSENVITKLLDGLEASIKETLTSQAAAREFLEKYKN